MKSNEEQRDRSVGRQVEVYTLLSQKKTRALNGRGLRRLALAFQRNNGREFKMFKQQR